jgi:hypothetical protein
MKGVNNNGTTIYDSYYAGFEENFTEGVGGTLDLYFQSQGVPAGAITTYDAAAAASTGDNDSYTLTTMAFTLALMGDFGMFGFEAEGVYIKGDLDGFDDDHAALALALQESTGFSEAAYGLYVNLFAKVDALKAGFIYAYGSADEEDGAYNWGDDFDLFVVMDDYIAYDFADRAGLTGFSAYKLYADYTMDKITVMVGAGYGASNWKDDDATFMEGDLGASYAFDENTAYTVMFGYAKTSDFYTADVDADAYRVYHKMAVKF